MKQRSIQQRSKVQCTTQATIRKEEHGNKEVVIKCQSSLQNREDEQGMGRETAPDKKAILRMC